MESRYESLWMDTAPSTSYAPLTEDIIVDVAVIGGGIAGLTAAYFLQQAGKKVAVLEAQKLASSTSGYTTAKVTILHDLKYDFLEQHYGLEKTRLYASSNQWAISALEKMVMTEKIDCAFQKVKASLYTNEDKELATLEKEGKTLSKLGLPLTVTKDITGFPFPIKTAVTVEDQASFHPRQFLVELANIIHQRGGQVFENTQVTTIKDGAPCILETSKAQIKADKVIIATNYPILDHDFFFLRLDQMRSYALAFETTNEVSDDLFIGIGQHEVTVRTYRSRDKTWVIIGGEDHPSGETQNTDQKYQTLKEVTKQMFADPVIEYQWSAQDSSPLDRVPLIGKVPSQDHIFVTTGYGEWGMTTSLMSAKLLTDLVLHQSNPWVDLYDPGRLDISASLTQMPQMAKQVLKGFGSYLTRRDDSNLDTLQPGEGRVISHHGQKIAVNRSSSGQICALSAVCTHMGCIVEWNQAEQSWDCPCHGSRFTNQGDVIRGPATKPLPRKEIEV